MSNIVSIGLPRRPNLPQKQGLLLQSFAAHRRDRDDVFWLKENAELLNILATGDAALPDGALDVYAQVYDGLEERMRFFPQYYRFLLSICLDLEDLGMAGNKGEALCAWVARKGLDGAELSDLQRAEAERLLMRRGAVSRSDDLRDRLIAFASRSDTFALPNKKASYELTHIVFYLSDYGRTKPGLPAEVAFSLEFAGLLAYLDQDLDLLAEVCIAQRFAGLTPSAIWEDWIAAQLGGFVLRTAPEGAVTDAYHEYLVSSWWAGLTGRQGFGGTPPKGGLQIIRHGARPGPLRAISEYMFHLGSGRSGNWSHMGPELASALGEEAEHILLDAAQSSPSFGAFFEGFARAEV
jgi:hypothetical protein